MKQKQKDPTFSQKIWTVSNGISMLRLLLTLPVVLLLRFPYVNRWGILALGLFAYLTDLADGYLARRFHQETSAGRIIDPLADKVFVAGVMLSLLSSGYVPLWYVISVLARDVLILLAGAWVSAKRHIVLASI
jgi:CDP-diacylglycerol--glycerol-3-phosphate 3-phosphatidyltransferase